MALEETLERVERDVQKGDLGKARDRLHGLIASYPDNLELRKRLGSVYWQLQMPEMAGRYWYLEDNRDEKMVEARKRFEAQFKNDPVLILFSLKFKGDMDSVAEPHAGRILRELEAQARGKHGWYAAFRMRGAAKHRNANSEAERDKTRNSIIRAGCVMAAILLAALFILGVANGILSLVRLAR